MANLIVGEVSHQVVAALRPLMQQIQRNDRSLADQLRRAASSVALNVAEADYSDPGNKRARLFTAAGSANETRAALRLAEDWGYCTADEARPARELVDRARPAWSGDGFVRALATAGGWARHTLRGIAALSRCACWHGTC